MGSWIYMNSFSYIYQDGLNSGEDSFNGQCRATFVGSPAPRSVSGGLSRNVCDKNYGGCGKPIIAGKIVTTKAEGKYPEVRFHKDHFECAYCHKNMAGQKYKRNAERFYCSQCHLQLFE